MRTLRHAWSMTMLELSILRALPILDAFDWIALVAFFGRHTWAPKGLLYGAPSAVTPSALPYRGHRCDGR